MFLCIYYGIFRDIACSLPCIECKNMKEMLITICAAAIMTAVYKAIAPTDRFGTQIKLLTACFFILSVISAVSGLNEAWDISDITIPDGGYNDYSVRLGESISEETAAVLRREISERLAEENIFPEKIYIDIHISDNGRISINEIKLVFDSRYLGNTADRAVVLVKKMTGTSIKVTAEPTPQSVRIGASQ